MKRSLLAAFVAVLVTPGAFAAAWEKPTQLSVSKICGNLVKSKTQNDGVQTVFTQTDAKGKAIQSYFLAPVGPSVQALFGELKLDESEAVCVVGLPSSLAAGTILVDSPNSFLTLQVVR